MSNAKAQMSNQIQSLNLEDLLDFEFEIQLTFACLPQAGILKI